MRNLSAVTALFACGLRSQSKPPPLSTDLELAPAVVLAERYRTWQGCRLGPRRIRSQRPGRMRCSAAPCPCASRPASTAQGEGEQRGAEASRWAAGRSGQPPWTQHGLASVITAYGTAWMRQQRFMRGFLEDLGSCRRARAYDSSRPCIDAVDTPSAGINRCPPRATYCADPHLVQQRAAGAPRQASEQGRRCF